MSLTVQDSQLLQDIVKEFRRMFREEVVTYQDCANFDTVVYSMGNIFRKLLPNFDHKEYVEQIYLSREEENIK